MVVRISLQYIVQILIWGLVTVEAIAPVSQYFHATQTFTSTSDGAHFFRLPSVFYILHEEIFPLTMTSSALSISFITVVSASSYSRHFHTHTHTH